MSATDIDAEELTDPELISQVRAGDVAAYGTLFSRHVDAATRLARVLVGGPDADDLVSEAFVKVLNVLLAGGGPDVAFRAYLLTAVRRLHVDKIRSNQKLTTTGDMTPYDPGVPFTDTAIAGFEGGAAAKAFASLPERWQLVLWHLEVENQKPADIAPLLGMSANSVSALAYRAREGLRQAFLNMHSGDLVSEDCRETHDLLGGYVRGALSKRDAGKVEDHLDHCRPCTAVYLELAEVNSSLAAVLGPALLGAAALGYLGGAGAAGAGAGALALVGRAKDAALGNLPATAAGLAAVGLVGVVAIAVGVRGPSGDNASADAPLPSAPSSSSAPATGTTTTAPGDSSTKATSPKKNKKKSATSSTSSTASTSSDSSSSTTSEAPLGATTGDAVTGGSTTEDQPKKKKKKKQSTDQTPPKPPRVTPKPPPTTPTDPTDPTDPEPLPSADVSVKVSVGRDGSGWVAVTIAVSGVPEGQSSRVTVTSTVPVVHNHSEKSCQGSGTTYTCIATSTPETFLFHASPRENSTYTVTAAVPDGWKDPVAGNNSATVEVVADGPAG